MITTSTMYPITYITSHFPLDLTICRLLKKLILLVFLAFTVGVGCDSPCVLNSQCSSSERCFEGDCLRACTAYFQCSGDQSCVDGICRTAPEGYCEAQRRAPDPDGGTKPLACEPPDGGLVDAMLAGEEGLDEGRMVEPRDQEPAGEEMTDMGMDASVGGGEAGEMAAGEMMAGESGVDLGMSAGEMSAGEMTAGEMTAGEMGGEMLSDMSVAGEPIDMGRPMSTTPWLYTSGPNLFQTGARQWVGRGVNIHDTRSCDACTWIQPQVTEVLRRIDEVVDIWGANLLRLNLESYSVASGRLQHRSISEDRAYLSDIERIVHHIGQKDGVYVILNLWRDPTLDDTGAPTEQTQEILQLLVDSFYDAPQVIFSVSPGIRQNDTGALDSVSWGAMNDAVTSIRDRERQLTSSRHLVIVPGLSAQGSDLSYYIDHPITAGGGENIVYETKIFQGRSSFDQLLTNPAQTLPVLIGEFGPRDTPPHMMTQSEALALIQEAERLNVSWAAWSFHMRCVSSAMLVDQTNNGCGIGMPLQPTEWGIAIQSQLGLN